MPTLNYTPQQAAVIEDAHAWFRNPSGIYRIDGKAGTGKTSCANAIASIARNPSFLTITGKAASRLRSKGCAASTIHSKIYRCFATEDPKTKRSVIKFSLNRDSDIIEHDLLLIDESSMVPERVARDLLSFNVPLLVLGDPAQLPPVKSSESYFMSSVTPRHTLTQIHRQALDSPILTLANRASLGEPLPIGTYGTSSVVPRLLVSPSDLLSYTQVLCGRNATRHALNAQLRALFHKGTPLPSTPVLGDRLICLRNDHELGLLNGVQYTVTELHDCDNPSFLSFSVTPEFDTLLPSLTVTAHASYFTHPGSEPEFAIANTASHFDFAYAITVHKAQGSEWPSVAIVDESSVFRAHSRNWLYTAITRAEDSVLVAR